MTKFRIAALAGVAAATMTGAALAGAHDRHVMTVALPDGQVAKIEYTGDVAPRVIAVPAQRIAVMPALPVAMLPAAVAPMADPFDAAFFAQFDAMHAMMQRQMQAMRAMAAMPAMPAMAAMSGPGLRYTATGNGGGIHFCSQSVSVTDQGAGKPAKVVTETHGDCGGPTAAPKTSAPTPAASSPNGLTIVKATVPEPVKLPTTTI